MTKLRLNGREITLKAAGDTPLLWAIRDEAGLTGTKFSCGIGMCGACTVHINGQAARSCITPLAAVEGASVTTIEGLDPKGAHPLQVAWIETQAPQCGYCQSGQIMAAVELLKNKPKPTDEDIDREITNICRCGTFQQIRAAIHAAANA
jgi:isoquinoline 1-oxidoreductase alpha subunit